MITSAINSTTQPGIWPSGSGCTSGMPVSFTPASSATRLATDNVI